MGHTTSGVLTGSWVTVAYASSGRDAEFARILSLVESGIASGGRFVVLTGEPGIGNTRLAHEAIRCALPGQAAGPGVTVLRAVHASALPPIFRSGGLNYLTSQAGLARCSPGCRMGLRNCRCSRRWPHCC